MNLPLYFFNIKKKTVWRPYSLTLPTELQRKSSNSKHNASSIRNSCEMYVNLVGDFLQPSVVEKQQKKDIKKNVSIYEYLSTYHLSALSPRLACLLGGTETVFL